MNTRRKWCHAFTSQWKLVTSECPYNVIYCARKWIILHKYTLYSYSPFRFSKPHAPNLPSFKTHVHCSHSDILLQRNNLFSCISLNIRLKQTVISRLHVCAPMSYCRRPVLQLLTHLRYTSTTKKYFAHWLMRWTRAHTVLKSNPSRVQFCGYNFYYARY
jgi:hypothetical protein